MNSNQLMRMLSRMAMASLMSVGIPRLVDWWARRSNPDRDPNRPLTPEEQKRAADAQVMAKRARDIARLTRRLGR
ncbi:hypothetical protein ACEYYB_11600 [Paracoccus sp. p4-l81]|uniref:hypothetical protein n=1 Tax=unclassified Paracoccus (in: a-proteobacteria) TaxID=2688777 RepID=UPI0035B7291D